jgi:HEAT repeat protein
MKAEYHKLVVDLLTHGDPDQRRIAAEDLGQVDEMGTTAILAVALADEHKGVRDAAARALLAQGGQRVARFIVEYVAHDSIRVRNLAADVLLRLGKDSILPLIPFLKHHDHDVRKFAVDILGSLCATEAVDEIIAMLRDPDDNVSISAVEALGNIGDPRAIDPLIALFEANEFMQSTIAEALGKIRHNRASDFLLLTLSYMVITGTYDRIVLFAIIEALGKVGDVRALRVLRAYVTRLEGKNRNALVGAIGHICERLQLPVDFPPSHRDALLAALQDPADDIRRSAARALLEHPDDAATGLLIHALGSSESLDELIIPALKEKPAAFMPAVHALQDPALTGKRQLVALIGDLALMLSHRIVVDAELTIAPSLVSQAADALEREWDGADEETRGSIVDALFRLDGDRAVVFMESVMSARDPWLRIHVIELLARQENPDVPALIARFLDDEEEMVRETAMGVLQNRHQESDTLG